MGQVNFREYPRQQFVADQLVGIEQADNDRKENGNRQYSGGKRLHCLADRTNSLSGAQTPARGFSPKRRNHHSPITTTALSSIKPIAATISREDHEHHVVVIKTCVSLNIFVQHLTHGGRQIPRRVFLPQFSATTPLHPKRGYELSVCAEHVL